MKMLLKVSIMTPTIKAYIMHMKKNVIDLSSDSSGSDEEGEGNQGHHHGHNHGTESHTTSQA